MRVKFVHSDTGEKNRIGYYAKQLLQRTLEPYNLQIRSVTIRVVLSTGVSLGVFDYHCVVKIHLNHGSEIKTEARDCDEILAIYRAVDKAKNIIENQSRINVKS